MLAIKSSLIPFTATVYFQFSLEVEKMWMALLTRIDDMDLFQLPSWICRYGAFRSSDDKDISGQIVFVVIQDQTGPVALFPFRRTWIRRFGRQVNILSLYRISDIGVCSVPICQNSDFLMIWHSLLGALRTSCIQWDVISLNDLIENTVSMGLYDSVRLLKNRYDHHLSSRLAVPICPDSSDSKILRNQRKRIEKKARALGKQGVVTCSFVNDRDSMQTTYDNFLAIEDSGWKGSNGLRTSLVNDVVQGAFYRKLMQDQSSTLRPVAACLFSGDYPIAIFLCVEVGRTLYMLKIAYSNEYAKYSPGSVLLMRLVDEYSSRNDIDFVDFITDGAWTDRWHPEKRKVYKTAVYNYTVGGLYVYCVEGIVHAVRILKRLAFQARKKWA